MTRQYTLHVSPEAVVALIEPVVWADAKGDGTTDAVIAALCAKIQTQLRAAVTAAAPRTSA